MPRVLDDGTFFAGIPDQEAMFTMATVVNREDASRLPSC